MGNNDDIRSPSFFPSSARIDRVRRSSVDSRSKPDQITMVTVRNEINKTLHSLRQLSFFPPKEQICALGPPGMQGPKGFRGRRGPRGAQGRKGSRGIRGEPGSHGKQGKSHKPIIGRDLAQVIIRSSV